MANLESKANRRAFVTGAILARTASGHPALQTAKNSGPAGSTPGRVVRVQARPGPIDLDTGKTALIVVDMQNDFGAKGGMFERADLDISGIQKAIPPTDTVVRTARNVGIKVLYLKIGFRPDLSDPGGSEAPNRTRHMFLGVGKEVRSPDGSPSRICDLNHKMTVTASLCLRSDSAPPLLPECVRPSRGAVANIYQGRFDAGRSVIDLWRRFSRQHAHVRERFLWAGR
jgi:hypothetical protein